VGFPWENETLSEFQKITVQGNKLGVFILGGCVIKVLVYSIMMCGRWSVVFDRPDVLCRRNFLLRRSSYSVEGTRFRVY
jgi:hypothetical protein